MFAIAAPKRFYHFSGQCLPWLWLLFGVTFLFGIIDGLFIAPPDYQQGDAYRIIYVHVPAAALSLGAYLFVAINSLMYLVWRIKIADVLAKVAAPIGAWFTLTALVTGALWGKPMWGAWWVWDARLTSELILLLLYLGLIMLRQVIPSTERAAKTCAIVSLVGVIDLPIIHYSVYWWNSLHQQSTLLGLHKPEIAGVMLVPLLAMLVALGAYFAALVLQRARVELLEREKQTGWVREALV